MKPFPAAEKAAGEGKRSPALQTLERKPRTIANGVLGDYERSPRKATGTDRFNFGRHRWLCHVARDAKLPGAAHRVAIILWEKQNANRGCAWPSLIYLAAELRMHKSTVIRSLRALRRRQWITSTTRGGRHRSNEYRIAFGIMPDNARDANE